MTIKPIALPDAAVKRRQFPEFSPRAERESERAERETARAERAKTELNRLRERLEELGESR